MRARLLIGSVLVAVLATLASACSQSPTPIPTTDVLGTWRGGSSTQLVLSKSGRFTARDLPYQRAEDRGTSFTGTGRWTMVAAGNGQEQHLDLSAGANGLGWIYVERSHGKVVLYFWLGDPDEGKRFVFTKS
jgi:hypothetical protein